MADGTKALKTVEPELVLDSEITVTTEEVIAIGMSEFEEDRKIRLLELEKEAKKASALFNKKNGAYAELCNKEAEKQTPDVKTATAALKKLFPDRREKMFSVCACFDNNRKAVKAEFSLSVGYHSIEASTPMKETAAMKEARKEVIELEDEVKAIRDEMITATRELSDLGSIERKCRAEIARTKLRGSAKGRKLLESMRGVKLPMLSQGKKK